jgi:hypothetical protein
MLPGLMRADVWRRLGFYGTFCGLIVSALIYCGSTRPVFAAGPERVGLPWDWSHQYVVFSKTDDPAVQAIIQKDPRAFHQWLRRNGAVYGVPLSFDTFVQSHGALFESPSAENAAEPRSASVQGKKTAKSDWGVSLGATNFNSVNSAGAPIYPAKYTFDINANPNCITDYAVFPTGAQGKTSTNVVTPNGQASIIAYNNLYSTQGGPGGFCNPPPGPLVYWAYINAACPQTTSSDPILSSPVISLDGTKVAWVTTTGKVQIVTYGVGFTNTSGESTLTPACIGSNASGGDNATLQTLTLANATHNPTSGVSVSEVFVDFNTDSAYVGDDDGYLHKISPFFNASGALQEVTTPGWQASHAYTVGNLIVDSNGFIEKCTTAGTSGSVTPGWSSVWNSNTNDNTVVWQNIGSAGGWPVYVTGSSGHTDSSKLNGPVFDSVSENVFIGGSNGSLYYVLDPGLGFRPVGSCANGLGLYPCLGLPGVATGVPAAAGSQADCAAASPGPTCMVMSNKQGFTDPLVVDSSHNLILAQFSNVDGTNAKVEQTNTSLSVFHSATLTSKENSTAYHSGTFDNTYYSTPGSGYYYLCGPAADGIETDLYRVSFTSGGGLVTLGSKNGTPLKLTTNGTSGNCSPLTEFYNPNNSPVHDWLYLSLDNHAVGCSSGSCVLSFTLGSAMVAGSHNVYGQGVSGEIQNMNGTGGIIVDNDANTGSYPQASNIYFSPVSNTLTCGDGTSSTGCAVKLSQAGLH